MGSSAGLRDYSRMKQSPLQANLEAAMSRLGLNPNSLADAAGLGPDAVRDIIRGKSASPRGDTLRKLAVALDIDVGALLGAEGVTFGRTGANAEQKPRAKRLTAEALVIKEYDVSAQGGDGTALADLNGSERHPVIGQWTLPADLLNAHLTPGMSPAVIRMVGNSMEPELASGDRVMVDTSARAPTPPGIYVLWDGLGLIIKQCELVMGTEPARVRITSLNKSYAAYELALDDVRIQGRVMGKWMWK